MDPIVLDSIPFRVDMPQLMKAVHMEADSDEIGDFNTLVREAEGIARPEAVYKVAGVDSRDNDYVVVDGVKLTSRIVSVNLHEVNRVFAYVATTGVELERWADTKDDILERYWADAVMLQGVRAAMTSLAQRLQEQYRPGQLARMNPGSLSDWPLREQRPLFSIIGEVERLIGVRLTESFLMVPRKSVSGIQFPTQETYENCMLCDREDCPNRRAPYDADLFERKYQVGAQ